MPEMGDRRQMRGLTANPLEKARTPYGGLISASSERQTLHFPRPPQTKVCKRFSEKDQRVTIFGSAGDMVSVATTEPSCYIVGGKQPQTTGERIGVAEFQ